VNRLEAEIGGDYQTNLLTKNNLSSLRVSYKDVSKELPLILSGFAVFKAAHNLTT